MTPRGTAATAATAFGENQSSPQPFPESSLHNTSYTNQFSAQTGGTRPAPSHQRSEPAELPHDRPSSRLHRRTRLIKPAPSQAVAKKQNPPFPEGSFPTQNVALEALFFVHRRRRDDPVAATIHTYGFAGCAISSPSRTFASDSIDAFGSFDNAVHRAFALAVSPAACHARAAFDW